MPRLYAPGHPIPSDAQRNLMRWVSLLLYAGDETATARNPLLEEAVVRGRIMELAMNKLSGSPQRADTAFFTSTLSVIRKR